MKNVTLRATFLILALLLILTACSKSFEQESSYPESIVEDSSVVLATVERENVITKYGKHDKYMKGVALPYLGYLEPYTIKAEDGELYSFYADTSSIFTSPYGDIVSYGWHPGANITVYYDGELTQDPATAIIKSLTTSEYLQGLLEERLKLIDEVMIQLEDPKIITGEEAMLAVIEELNLKNMIYYEVPYNPTRNYYANEFTRIYIDEIMLSEPTISSKRYIYFDIGQKLLNSENHISGIRVRMSDGLVDKDDMYYEE